MIAVDIVVWSLIMITGHFVVIVDVRAMNATSYGWSRLVLSVRS